MQRATSNAMAMLSLVVLSNIAFAAGGTDGGRTPSDNPDPLTGGVLEDKYRMDTSDHGPGPSHSQINQGDINENRAKLRCQKLAGKAKQDCLAKIN